MMVLHLIKLILAQILCASKKVRIFFAVIFNFLVYKLILFMLLLYFPDIYQWHLSVKSQPIGWVIFAFSIVPGIMYAVFCRPPKWAEIKLCNLRESLRMGDKMAPWSGYGNYRGAVVSCANCKRQIPIELKDLIFEKDKEGYQRYYVRCPHCNSKFRVSF